MTVNLAVDALADALALRGGVDTIAHSDRGSQSRSHAYGRALRTAQLRAKVDRAFGVRDVRRSTRIV